MIKLDIGCGAELTNIIEHNYIGIDIDIPTEEEMFQYMGKIYDINDLIYSGKFIQLDVNSDELPFFDNTVDIIESSSCIGRGYITNLTEIIRVLKNDGTIILYNSYFNILPELLKLFQNIDIQFMTGHFKYDSPEVGYQFRLTCYNKFNN
jgi:SAM-dependent methyltransferase